MDIELLRADHMRAGITRDRGAHCSCYVQVLDLGSSALQLGNSMHADPLRHAARETEETTCMTTAS